MTRYEGTIFGFNYDIEKADDDEFITWLISKLKMRIPTNVWVSIVTKLIQQSDEYQVLKTKLQDHEQRISALEGG